MRLFRALLRVWQPVSPTAAAWLADRLFFTAPRHRLSHAARAFLATGRRFSLRVDGRRVVGWSWGPLDGTAPVVYLSHGWASRGSRLAAFIEPLRAAGHAVVTYDAPGHGASGRGMSSMPEFARALNAVVAHTANGRVPRAVIAHSLGCAGAALALSWGLEVGRLVFLAPAADPPGWVRPFAGALGLRPHVTELLRARSERRLRVRWTDLNVCDMARRFSRHAPLLIVHDKNDETVAWNDGSLIAAAWPGSQLVTTHGLGHRGVTRDDHVVQQVVDFVKDETVTKTSRHDSESQRLEYELFYREERYSLNSTPRPSPSPVWGS